MNKLEWISQDITSESFIYWQLLHTSCLQYIRSFCLCPTGVREKPSIQEGSVSYVDVPRAHAALGITIVGGVDTPLVSHSLLVEGRYVLRLNYRCIYQVSPGVNMYRGFQLFRCSCFLKFRQYIKFHTCLKIDYEYMVMCLHISQFACTLSWNGLNV